MPLDLPPPPVAALVQSQPDAAGWLPLVRLGQAPQEPAQVPQVDILVEVIGNLPLQAKLQDVARLLGIRHRKVSNRVYKPTILELITLVERNPERPRGKAWNSIMALSMKYDEVTGMVTVEYCVDRCGFEPRTGELDPRRRMVSYRAPESAVLAKVDKKLAELAKYAR